MASLDPHRLRPSVGQISREEAAEFAPQLLEAQKCRRDEKSDAKSDASGRQQDHYKVPTYYSTCLDLPCPALALVWFGLVWFGLVWFGLVLPCLALARLGSVWLDTTRHDSTTTRSHSRR